MVLIIITTIYIIKSNHTSIPCYYAGRTIYCSMFGKHFVIFKQLYWVPLAYNIQAMYLSYIMAFLPYLSQPPPPQLSPWSLPVYHTCDSYPAPTCSPPWTVGFPAIALGMAPGHCTDLFTCERMCYSEAGPLHPNIQILQDYISHAELLPEHGGVSDADLHKPFHLTSISSQLISFMLTYCKNMGESLRHSLYL